MSRKMITALVAIAAVLGIALCVACAHQRQSEQAPAAVKPAGEPRPQPVPAVAGSELYRDEPRPLLPVECGRCHRQEYEQLRASRSRHRFDCLQCHRQLHAYRPPADNYAAVMPRCGRCHEDRPHGQDFSACRRCHDPHAPTAIPFAAIAGKISTGDGRKVGACEHCHRRESAEMTAHPCGHNRELGCTGCHAERHGVKPSCLECHEPHVAGQGYDDCLVCHRPHSAGDIQVYPQDTADELCAACHGEIAARLKRNPTRHSGIACAFCHRRHGQVPDCRQCHGEPHDPAMMEKFPDCLQCHIDPHNLPEK